MAQAAKLGVFLCKGGRQAAATPEYQRMRWAAEAAAAGGAVYEITQACQAEGAGALARIAAQEGLDQVMLGACPLAGPGGPLGPALTARGLSPTMVRMVSLCSKPNGEPSQCQVTPGAERDLCAALAGCSRPEAAGLAQVATVTRVLVVGGGLVALSAVRGLLDAGHPVMLLTPAKRLAPPQPELGAEAQAEAAALAEVLEKREGLEVVRRGELVSLLGPAGDFIALVRDRAGWLIRREVGAVLMAQGPPREINGGGWLPEQDPRVISLEDLLALAQAPEHLKARTGGEQMRVGIAVGLEREAGPQALAAACRAAGELAQAGAVAAVFTRNAKVAGLEVEELTQKMRQEGALFFKFTQGGLRVTPGGGGLNASFDEEVLGREMTMQLDLLAVDQRPAPDAAWRGLARTLGLEVNPAGHLQPRPVSAQPVASGRGGVFLAGAARGSYELDAGLDQAAQALVEVRRLLGRGSVPAPQGVVKVDRRACALCLTCVRVCPQGAMGRVERRPVANPLTCTSCGTCAAECPMDAIQIVNQEDDRYRRRIHVAASPIARHLAGTAPKEALVLACANSAVKALAAARRRGLMPGEGVRVVEVPCAGKVDVDFVLSALGEGFDAVMLVSCFPDACYSLTGNLWAGHRLEHLKRLVAEAGLEPERLMAASLAPGMAQEAADLMSALEARLEELGPNPLKQVARVRDFLGHFTVRMDRDYTIVA